MGLIIKIMHNNHSILSRPIIKQSTIILIFKNYRHLKSRFIYLLVINNYYWNNFSDIWCDSTNEQTINIKFQYCIYYTRKWIKREVWHKKINDQLAQCGMEIPNYFWCKNVHGNVIYLLKYVPCPVNLYKKDTVRDNSIGTDYLSLSASKYLK